MNSKANFKTGLVIFMFLLAMVCTATNGQIIYVDSDATGENDGTRWADAYIYLQDALADASNGDEILVAEGVYKPDEDTAHPTGTGDRTATFQLKNGVIMKGGYAGFGGQDPNVRDIQDSPER